MCALKHKFDSKVKKLSVQNASDFFDANEAVGLLMRLSSRPSVLVSGSMGT